MSIAELFRTIFNNTPKSSNENLTDLTLIITPLQRGSRYQTCSIRVIVYKDDSVFLTDGGHATSELYFNLGHMAKIKITNDAWNDLHSWIGVTDNCINSAAFIEEGKTKQLFKLVVHDIPEILQFCLELQQ